MDIKDINTVDMVKIPCIIYSHYHCLSHHTNKFRTLQTKSMSLCWCDVLNLHVHCDYTHIHIIYVLLYSCYIAQPTEMYFEQSFVRVSRMIYKSETIRASSVWSKNKHPKPISCHQIIFRWWVKEVCLEKQAQGLKWLISHRSLGPDGWIRLVVWLFLC